jgi:flagellar hook-length control protein FliK
MEMPMTAVPDVTAGVVAEITAGGGGAANGTAPAVQTGDKTPFGKLFVELALLAGQNAEVAATVSQSVDSTVATPQPAQSQLAVSAAATDQKGSGKAVALEAGGEDVLAVLTDQGAPALPMLAPQLVVALGAVAPKPLPEATVATSKSQEENPVEPKEQQAALGNVDVSFMLQMLQQPKPATTLPGQQPLAEPTVTATTAIAAQPAGQAPLQPEQPAALSAAAEQPRGVVQVVAQPEVKLSASAADEQQAALATAQTASKDSARLHEAKPAERGAWRSKLAEQGVTVSASESADQPAKIDLGFMDVVIRESSDPTEAVRPDTAAVAGPEQGKVLHANPLAAHPLESSDPNRSVQTSSTEPAKPVSHEQIVSQVREKLATVDLGRDNGQVVLRLHPEELGELKIDVRMENQRLRVDIVTESPTVKEALLSNMNSLREVLAKHNIAMDRFDVSTGGNGFQQAFRDGRTWEQQQNGAFNRPLAKWSTGGDSAQAMAAAAAHYARNPEYGMVDVRF